MHSGKKKKKKEKQNVKTLNVVHYLSLQIQLHNFVIKVIVRQYHGKVNVPLSNIQHKFK